MNKGIRNKNRSIDSGKQYTTLATSPMNEMDGFGIPGGDFKRMPLLTADELVFFNMLSLAIDQNHTIFTKIPLENVIHAATYNEKHFLASKEIDYLICDKDTSLPLCVIDIHGAEKPSDLPYFLNKAGIAVIHLEGDITAKDLRQKIRDTKPDINIPYPTEIHDVFVTVVDTDTRKVQHKTRIPTITQIAIPRTPMQRSIHIGHWIIWSAFGLMIFYAFLKVLRLI